MASVFAPRVTAVRGDLNAPDLGISPAGWARLRAAVGERRERAAVDALLARAAAPRERVLAALLRAARSSASAPTHSVQPCRVAAEMRALQRFARGVLSIRRADSVEAVASGVIYASSPSH